VSISTAAMEHLRREKLWVAIGLAFVALVIFLSVAPDPVRAPTVDDFKTGHILAYAWCMLYFAQVWRDLSHRLAIALSLIVLGIGLEFVQDLLPWHRDFAVSDMVDDAIGVGIGFALGYTPLGNALRWVEARIR
jgi:di/tricarboxylate transporter